MSRIETVDTLFLIRTHDASMRQMISKSLRAAYAEQVNHLQMRRRESDMHISKKLTNIFCNHDDCRKKDANEEYE